MTVNKKTLAEFVTKFEQIQFLTNLDLENWDPSTRPGMITRKNEAIRELEVLKEQYGQLLSENAVVFLLTGDNQAEVAKVAEDSMDCYASSANALYEFLADKVQGLSARFGVDHLRQLSEYMMDMDGLKGLESIPFPEIDMTLVDKPINTRDDLVALIRASVEKGEAYATLLANAERVKSDFASSLARRFITTQVLKAAIEDKHQDSVLGVVITGATEKQLTDFAGLFGGGKTVTVDTSGITGEDIMKELVRLAQGLRKGQE